jgi:ribosomal protein L11 methyltransferase
MPYRIDTTYARDGSVDILVELGALDIEANGQGLAAILPDGVKPETVSAALGLAGIAVSAATPRDNGSVWLLSPQPVRIGATRIALADSRAFGTGHHPTTALCIEALQEILSVDRVESVLDVGTGSGILALAALTMGVPQALGIDTDAEALQAASENARLNGMEGRLQLLHGDPAAIEGQWPLIVANILAAPLMEMAPALMRRLRSRGRVILSGIPSSLESEVRQVYRHSGIGHIESKTRGGWTMLVAQASW